MDDVLERIAAQRIVPVIRTSDVEDAVATARTCARAGMRVVELTRSTPKVGQALRELASEELVLGVGTITGAEQVADAAAYGARFVVSYFAPEGMVDAAKTWGLTAIPGALTPTEIRSCLDQGADAIKLFPARILPPQYLDDLRAVLPELRVIITGGIETMGESIREWLRVGAVAVGIGSHLGTVATVGPEEVELRARALLESSVLQT